MNTNPLKCRKHDNHEPREVVKRATLSQQVHAKYHILRNGYTNYSESSAIDAEIPPVLSTVYASNS